MKSRLNSRTYERKPRRRARAVDAGLRVEQVVFLALALLSLSFFLAAFPAHGAYADEISAASRTLLDTPPTDVDPPPGSDDPTTGETPPGDPGAPPGADDPIGDVPSVGDPTDSPGDSTPPPGAEDSFEVTGWWYNMERNGSGISIEVRNGVMFLAWYTYDDSGLPIWHSSAGLTEASSNVWTGSLYSWTGEPLGINASPLVAGTVTVSFDSALSGTLAWNLDIEGDGSISIVKFLPAILGITDLTAAQKDSRDIHGWWYDPSHNGMGFFMEALDNVIFVAWYNYRDDGSRAPLWWSMSSAEFTTGDTSIEVQMQERVDGWCIGCPVPTTDPIATDINPTATIQLNGDGTGKFIWNGTEFNLQRFRFDEL